MAETLGTVASILQLVDTALRIRERIQDFSNAPQEQQKLLSEMDHLRPLVQELQDRLVANASSGILQRMKNPLEDFKATMERFTEKLRPGDGPLSKFSNQLTWTLWSKKDAQEYLSKFEQFKSLLNSWLLVDLWDMSQHHQHESGRHFKDLAEQRDRDHKAVTGSLGQLSIGILEQRGRIDSVGRSVDDVTKKIGVVNTGVAHISDTHERERQEKERMQIIDWLSPINFFLRHGDISHVREKDTATQLYQQHREEGTPPSLDDICDILNSSLIRFPQVYIIIDAIDEYPEVQRWILLKHLTAMDTNVNVMITSRPNITPDASLPNLDTIEIRANEDDLQKYIDTQIQRSPRLLTHLRTQPELREEIHEKISETADGMFLLAKLHLESLTAKSTIKAV
ncbi:Serine/threonine-protein kinase chk2 [Mycena venus]|uniref:Serine/threonine-protein kinase chk2 n=1 Tax=Mycena venus TaxID=2733690 RepID=A0A8H6YW53_9AGAR|nr:Serine/threonine-protein kinase chk2 [Mycena venus]